MTEVSMENDIKIASSFNQKEKSYFKNVLFVGPHYNQLGGIASVLEIYHKSITDFNFISSYLKGSSIHNVLYFIRSLLKFMYVLLINRNIKIVHIHTAVKGSFVRKSIFLLIAKLFGKKTILHIHSGFFKDFYESNKLARPFIKFILNQPSLLIVLSDEWKSYFDSITNKRSVIINNPVVLPKAIDRKLRGNPIKVLFLNRLVKEKGILDLLEFIKENREWLQDSFKFIIAGAGNAESQMLSTIKNNQLETLIEFRGWVVGKAKDEIIKECDLFILTSYFEGLPMSILEAMSYGKSIIASNVGGIPRVVKNKKNGWLTEAGDIKSLRTIFQQIKSQPEILDQYGDQSLAIVQDYSPEKVTESLNKLYAGLISTAN